MISDQKANQAFYEWEQSEYKEGYTPLSDYDRVLWVEGYKAGVEALFTYAIKQGGEFKHGKRQTKNRKDRHKGNAFNRFPRHRH
jgi:hypothetical protein